ncbi:MAG: DUF4783 domain-containing protein [Prevotellaceae bacterium]|nr:DUF4783 domain-containing protein [Prevotellaceae bacterium]
MKTYNNKVILRKLPFWMLIPMFVFGVNIGSFAQHNSITVALIDAFQRANFGSMAVHFNSQIEIDLPFENGSNVVAKSQAVSILNHFISKNVPSSIGITRNDEVADVVLLNFSFTVANGNSFKATIFIRNSLISQIKIVQT